MSEVKNEFAKRQYFLLKRIIKYSTRYNKNMSMYRGHASKVQDAFEMVQGRWTSLNMHMYILAMRHKLLFWMRHIQNVKRRNGHEWIFLDIYFMSRWSKVLFSTVFAPILYIPENITIHEWKAFLLEVFLVTSWWRQHFISFSFCHKIIIEVMNVEETRQ